jgi:hypothetical protein
MILREAEIVSASVNPSDEYLTIKFRNGMFLAPSRTYGENFMEPILRKYLGLSKSNTPKNDAVNDNGKPQEIKCSQVLLSRPKKKASLVEKIILESENNVLNRLIPFGDCYDSKYDANIQNVKRDHFSKLVYVMLFEDCIKIFESDKEDISNIPNWSGKHGRYDEFGKSGQFAIRKNNIKWHLENNLVSTLTWDEVYVIAKGL